MTSDYVFIIDLAEHLGRTSCGIHGIAHRLGIRPVLKRRAASGKGALAVTVEEARRIKENDIPVAKIIDPADI